MQFFKKPVSPHNLNPSPRDGQGVQTLDSTLFTMRDLLRSLEHPFSVRQSFEGIQIFGAPGSGKTSASGATIAMAMLRAGYGGLVLTAKVNEVERWRRYAKACGREQDLVIITPGGEHSIDFLGYMYELAQSTQTPLTLNIVELFLRTMGTLASSEGASSEPFWEHALRQLITNSVDLCRLADDRVTLSKMVDIILTAPRTHDSLTLQSGRRGSCMQALHRADGRYQPEDEGDVEQVVAYFMEDFAALSERTRSVIVTSLTSRATSLLRSPIRELLCTRTTPMARPEASHLGKILVLDIPVLRYGEVGRLAQTIYKTVWQLATSGRTFTLLPDGQTISPSTPPVFLWADESQLFVTDQDAVFQQTSRESGAATVYLTQNLPNYHAMLARGSDRSRTESLLGNLNTKILHANGDPETNEWSSRLFGDAVLTTRSMSLRRGEATQMGRAEHIGRVVNARDFSTLRRGGPACQRQVDAIVHQTGRMWSDDPVDGHLLRTSFTQQ